MHEPSDGIAEEIERQLQLALAAATITARRVVAARQQQIEQAQRDSTQAARQLNARIDSERQLAAARLQPVFDSAWWETATPQQVADMWQQATSWRDPEDDPATPTIFDHAAGRIGQEVGERTGLDVSQVVTLAAVQNLEHEHQTTPGPTAAPDLATPRRFDDRQRREQLRARLIGAGVPETAIEARTLADLGQAREATEAAHPPVATAPRARPAPARHPSRKQHRQR